MPETPKSSVSKSTESTQVSSNPEKLASNVALSKPKFKTKFDEFQAPLNDAMRLEAIWGNIPTVDFVPDWKPRNFYEQFAIYDDDVFSGLYYYDFVNQEWRHHGVLYKKNTQTSVAFGTLETTILTLALPPIAANESLRIRMLTTQTGGTSSTTRLKFGSTLVKAVATDADEYHWEVNINNRNSQSSQYISGLVAQGDETLQDAFVNTATEDLSSTKNLIVTYQDSAGSNTANIEFIHIQII